MIPITIHERQVGQFEPADDLERFYYNAACGVVAARPLFDPIVTTPTRMGEVPQHHQQFAGWERLAMLVRVAATGMACYRRVVGGYKDKPSKLHAEIMSAIVRHEGTDWLFRAVMPAEVPGSAPAGSDKGRSATITMELPHTQPRRHLTFVVNMLTEPDDCADHTAYLEADLIGAAEAVMETYDREHEAWALEVEPKALAKPPVLLLWIADAVVRMLTVRHPYPSLTTLRHRLLGTVAALGGTWLPNVLGQGQRFPR